MTPREVILKLARMAFNAELIQEDELKELCSDPRGFFRLKQMLNGFETQKPQAQQKPFKEWK